jgi:pilus assembly protein Flp/PilA
MKSLFNRFVREEEGQDLIEYALLAALIAVASITILSAIATGTAGVFQKVTAALDTVGS